MKVPLTIPLAACLISAALPAFSQVTLTPTVPASTAAGDDPIIAKSQTEPEISLEELLRRARRKSPQILAALAGAASARHRANAWRAPANPTLHVVPGFSGNAAARDEEIIVAQSLDLFGQRSAERRVQEARARAAAAGVHVAGLQLTTAVKEAAAELFAAQEGESLALAQLEIARGFLAAAGRKAEIGDAPPVQAQRAELEVARLENDATVAASERMAARATLNQLIGEPATAPLRVALPSALGHNSAEIGAQRALLLAGLTARPDIRVASADLEAAQAEVTVAARQRLPLFELQGRRDTVTRSGGSTALRAVITVPLFDYGSVTQSKKSAQAQARANQAQLSLLKNQAAAQLEITLVRLRQRSTTAENYRSRLVPQTLELLRKTQIGFAQGASSYLEVLEAQRTTRSVQNEYLQALVGVQLAQTALDAAAGTTFPN